MSFYQIVHCIALIFWMMVSGIAALAGSQTTFYVATDGNDNSGDGSMLLPWATIRHALDNVPDNSLILVRPGTYNGQTEICGTFPIGVTIRSEQPYQALLRHNSAILVSYEIPVGGCGNITIEGFNIAHDGPGAEPLLVQIDGGAITNGNGGVNGIVLRNNILHDSYNNDLLKINNGSRGVRVEGNMFYNQSGSDEHIDVNGAVDITIEGNVFFNDFVGSGRVNNNDTSSYLLIKDSANLYQGSNDIVVRNNVFLNWEGSTGTNFLLLGEDGQAFHEARDIMIENNLMLGNSNNVMRAPFGLKGARDIVFRNNTVVGDLPALAFAMRFNTEGANPNNDNIQLYNNIWSDPTGTMGARNSGDNNDFSDTQPGQTNSFTLDNNLYWNGGQTTPSDPAELINPDDDANAVIADPLLASQTGLIIPRWNPTTNQFADGATTISAVLENLVRQYGALASGSAAIDAANAANAPSTDILGQARSNPDIGAYEKSEIANAEIFQDQFE